MKSQKFVSLVGILALLWIAAGNAQGEDELPPPEGMTEEVPFNPPPQEEGDLPDPSLGEEDALPEPQGGLAEKEQNKVNPMPLEDEVFLPPPEAQDNTSNFVPLASAPTYENSTEADWRAAMNRRPTFSLHGGAGIFNYGSNLIAPNIRGTTLGASVRLFDFAQTVFLHAYGSYSWVNLSTVAQFPNVKDKILHYGGLLEVGIGRRISLFGSLLYRNHTLRSDTRPGMDGLEPWTLDDLQKDSNQSFTSDGWKLGIGAQYDFYVVPHGSIGIRGHVEPDMMLVALTMALEPKPRKRLSLNFDEAKE